MAEQYYNWQQQIGQRAISGGISPEQMKAIAYGGVSGELEARYENASRARALDIQEKQFEESLSAQQANFARQYGLSQRQQESAENQFAQTLGITRDQLTTQQKQFAADLAYKQSQLEVANQQFAQTLATNKEQYGQSLEANKEQFATNVGLTKEQIEAQQKAAAYGGITTAASTLGGAYMLSNSTAVSSLAKRAWGSLFPTTAAATTPAITGATTSAAALPAMTWAPSAIGAGIGAGTAAAAGTIAGATGAAGYGLGAGTSTFGSAAMPAFSAELGGGVAATGGAATAGSLAATYLAPAAMAYGAGQLTQGVMKAADVGGKNERKIAERTVEGAVIGSFIPVVGTAIGAALGAAEGFVETLFGSHLCTRINTRMELTQGEKRSMTKLKRYAIKQHRHDPDDITRGYFANGGRLVEAINAQPDSEKLYDKLKSVLVGACAKLVETNEMETAYKLYRGIVLSACREYNVDLVA